MVDMEPTEINGGRFYARPIHTDERIDDRPALAALQHDLGREIDVERARDWTPDTETDTSSGSSYAAWAVCEQTNVEMIAFAELNEGTLSITPIGDPQRVLPNDPVLPPKTPADAASEIRGPITRWARAQGLEVRD